MEFRDGRVPPHDPDPDDVPDPTLLRGHDEHRLEAEVLRVVPPVPEPAPPTPERPPPMPPPYAEPQEPPEPVPVVHHERPVEVAPPGANQIILRGRVFTILNRHGAWIGYSIKCPNRRLSKNLNFVPSGMAEETALDRLERWADNCRENHKDWGGVLLKDCA